MKKANKTSKLLATLLGLSLFLGGTAAAKDGQCKRNGDCSKKVEKISQKLELNDSQEAQFLAIFESYKPTMQSLRAQMKDTFTEAQRESMKADRQANKGKRGERGKLSKEARKEAHEARLDSLGVSEGQKQQLTSLRNQLREQRKSQRAELMATLGADQQEVFKEMRGRRGHRGHSKHKS